MNLRLKPFGKRIAKVLGKKSPAPKPFQRDGGIIERKSSSRHLMYTKKFGQFLRNNPGIIRDFMEARKKLEAGFGPTIRVGIIMVTELDRKIGHAETYRVEIGNRVLFVKRGYAKIFYWDQGTAQFMAYRKLEKMLTKNIELAKYHFGWSDRERVFIVTDFYDLERIESQSIPEGLEKEFKRFAEKAKTAGISEIVNRNAFHDKRRNKIIVFDPELDMPEKK